MRGIVPVELSHAIIDVVLVTLAFDKDMALEMHARGVIDASRQNGHLVIAEGAPEQVRTTARAEATLCIR